MKDTRIDFNWEEKIKTLTFTKKEQENKRDKKIK